MGEERRRGRSGRECRGERGEGRGEGRNGKGEERRRGREEADGSVEEKGEKGEGRGGEKG
jgi:ribonuclease E